MQSSRKYALSIGILYRSTESLGQDCLQVYKRTAVFRYSISIKL